MNGGTFTAGTAGSSAGAATAGNGGGGVSSSGGGTGTGSASAGTAGVTGGGAGDPPIVDLFNGTDLTGFQAYREPMTTLTSAQALEIFKVGKLANKVLAVTSTSGQAITSGPLALQAEHAEVFYRNIRIQELP